MVDHNTYRSDKIEKTIIMLPNDYHDYKGKQNIVFQSKSCEHGVKYL